MSNAMRFGKRTLAGVAAGALALGALTIASAPAASAGKTIKPKTSVAATVNAVRATTQGTSTLTLPKASMEWAAGETLRKGNATVDLTTAPTASAKMSWGAGTGADDSIALNDNPVSIVNSTPDPFATPSGYVQLDDSAFYFNVDQAGLYAGLIYNGTDTVTFNFTTAGIPTSIALRPATQTVLVGAVADLTVTLLDAAGKPTQPQTVDSVSLASSPSDDTLISAANALIGPAWTPITQITNTGLASGTGYFALATNPLAGGSTVVTATPAGTLASTGVTAQTATVVKSGTVATNSVANLTVSAPTNAVNNGTLATTNRTAQVQNPTTTITVTVDDTTSAAAGNKLRFAAYGGTGAVVNGQAASSIATAVFTDVTTDANKKATLTYSLSGTALLAGQSLTIKQVNVLDAPTTNPYAATLTVAQTTAAVQPANIVPTPATALAKVGESTAVTVQVDDSFGAKMSGWIVNVYRGTSSTPPQPTMTSTTLVGTATTNALGSASLTLTPLATTVNGGVEYYWYEAVNPIGGAKTVSSTATTINYTTSGNITSMTVTPNGGTAGSAFSNTVSTLTTAPVILVPDDTSGAPVGVSTGSVTLSTGVNAVAPTGRLAQFTVLTAPVNTVTATVTEASGLYLSTTAPTATTAWSSGKQSVTFAGNNTAVLYVWGTKTGTHDVVFSSGGITLTGKVKVANQAQDAYDITITPEKANVARGGFTTLTAKVTDYWGNPVATTAGALTGVATGEVLLGGQNNTAPFTTAASGEANVSVIAANTVGAGSVTLTPTTAGAPPAWVAGYTKPASFTRAPTLTAVSLITVGEAPADKSITITGSRTTVSGKPGIKIDGVVTGIADGKTVIPYFRFPGETTFAQGSARPVITDGSFTWQRKTGKKFYAYVTSDDGVTKSNRVIIPAN